MKRPRLAPVACALGLLLLMPRAGQSQPHDELAVKAALVFNLTKYVEWPQGNNEVVIGFVGEGPMGEVLKKMLDGKTSESRPIHVLLSPSDQELERCYILYIADPSPRKIHAALDRVRDKSILTVGDTESFVREGGMISLVTVGDLVQIQVRLEVARESRLKISSRLLNIVVLVPPAPEVKN
ncbi:MAG: YfiR family protein [Terriglobales bacterium]